MSTNSRESPTNTPGKNFAIFISRQGHDIRHTPYNFPHANGDPQREFQRQNDSKTLARLSKCVGRCQQRNAMPKGGSNSEDLFAIAVMTGELS